MKRNRRRYAVAALLAFVVATASFAFAAENTIADGGKAGIGDGDVSGYSVTNVSWNLNNGSPDKVSGVSFTLSAAASEAYARALDAPDGTAVSGWATCTNPSAFNWTCTFSTEPNTLDVEAVEVSSAS
jgi:opacity protein-like surface antigen